MGGVKAATRLAEQEQRLLGREPAALFEDSSQVCAGDVEHRDVEQTVARAGVVDRDHVRVAQAGGDPRLADEPLPETVVGREVGRQDLERDRVTEARMLGQVDDAHVRAADHRVQAVPGELGPNHRLDRHQTSLPGGSTWLESNLPV